MSIAKKHNADYDVMIKKVSDIVQKISGNVLEDKQALMVQTRVKKRMLELGIESAADYIKYLDQNMEKESGVLVSLLTTHHTFFFREFSHFEFLKKNLLKIVSDVKARGENTVKIWCAASSRGQEVYSLAMFFSFYLPKVDPKMKFKIVGSDIDPESIKVAKNGVYHRKEIKSVPMNYIGDNWARGKGEIADFVKAKKTLTDHVSFRVVNLLDFNDIMFNERFDVIFCRNVFIYFKEHQIKTIMENFDEHLYDTGFYFSGISESLGGIDLPILTVGPSVYCKSIAPSVKAAEAQDSTPITSIGEKTSTQIRQIDHNALKSQEAPAVDGPTLPEMPAVLKVLCVDDSKSILTLLSKIFGADEEFEVVGTAKNGVEAQEMVAKLKPDIMTLDIHMPEMDGVTYLEKNFRSGHCPVVMISSASRDDSDAAMRALRAGASDFIEKPALNNIMERGEEIKTKLKVAYMDKMFETVAVSTMDREFEHKIEIKNPQDKFRVIYSSISDQKKVVSFFDQVHGHQPPSVMFYEGQDNILAAVRDELDDKLSCKVELLDDMPDSFQKDTVYLADFKKMYDPICEGNKSKTTSFIVYGKASKHATEKILNWENANLLVEDLNYQCELTEIASDVVPATSFAYMSCEFLSKK
jgi:chemotaxis protein methyltransferase CheR